MPKIRKERKLHFVGGAQTGTIFFHCADRERRKKQGSVFGQI